MSYIVNTADVRQIKLNEPDRVKSILQNVSIILRTCQRTVPLYREFGLPYEFLDRPQNVALPALVVEVSEAIQAFEPRARLETVDYSADKDGTVQIRVEVSIEDESES